jgi:PAN domain
MRWHFPLTACVYLCCAVLLSSAYAATITAPGFNYKASLQDQNVDVLTPSDPVRCDVIIDGPIAKGDAATLKQRVGELMSAPQGVISYFLCLRSPGGDLDEALKIARFVKRTQRPSIATVIEDGQTCASACALIFLAGNAPARKGAWPSRFLHRRGRLIFHSYRLSLDNLSDNDLANSLRSGDNRSLRREIEDLYELGLRDEQDVIAIFQASQYNGEVFGGPWVRPGLFLEMFAQGPNEFVCVDTVDAVGRWNIQVFGVELPEKPTKQQYANACHNLYHWRSDSFATDSDQTEEQAIDLNQIKEAAVGQAGKKGDSASHRRITVPYDAVTTQLTCQIDIQRDKDGSEETSLSFDGQSGGLFDFDALSYFTASTPLAELPTTGPASNVAGRNRSDDGFTIYQNSLMNGCAFKRIPNLSSDACQSQCASTSACVAYSYNRVTRICELKHTLTARRLDPRWLSGVPKPAASESSKRASHMTMIYQDLSVNGVVIDATKLEDPLEGDQACAEKCEGDNSCLAMKYDNNNNVCTRFSSVTSLSKESDQDTSIDAAIKTQN